MSKTNNTVKPIESTDLFSDWQRIYGKLDKKLGDMNYRSNRDLDELCVITDEMEEWSAQLKSAEESRLELLEALRNLLPVAVKLIDEAHERGESWYPAGNIQEVIRATCAVSKASSENVSRVGPLAENSTNKNNV